MKKLEELGISPTPWKIRVGDFEFDVVDTNNEIVSEYQFIKPDIRLIAASPKMYEALREAVKSYCEGCNDFVNEDQRCDTCECPARKWRAVLAEAVGESEVK